MKTFHSYAKLPEDNALNHVWSSLTFMLYTLFHHDFKLCFAAKNWGNIRTTASTWKTPSLNSKADSRPCFMVFPMINNKIPKQLSTGCPRLILPEKPFLHVQPSATLVPPAPVGLPPWADASFAIGGWCFTNPKHKPDSSRGKLPFGGAPQTDFAGVRLTTIHFEWTFSVLTITIIGGSINH